MSGLLGAILAGGRSSRFGSDKALAQLHGRRLIDWVRDGLESHVDAIVVCGREEGIPDRPAPDLGPLGGINAALHHAAALGLGAVITAPCDVPMLPAGTIERLSAATGPAYLDSLPVVGRWPSDLADRLDSHMKGPDRSIVGWARLIGAQPIAAGADIANVNTRDDLERLAAIRPRP